MESCRSQEPVELSFVVIGYNEAERLGACLESVRDADLDGVACEVIYVDGGSKDDSLAIAGRAGVDLVLGGDRSRKAAENRNLGFEAARGEYVQFVDGDMVLWPDWPKAALALLGEREDVAVVSGKLAEANRSVFFRAMQLDWIPETGEVSSCGGAAMFRREALERTGGFPEDVAFGEEPYLCWRIRNELGLKVYQLDRFMADHDLGFSGFGDYWRRCVRTGAAYAEISTRCYRSNDRLWFGKTVGTLVWALALTLALVLLAVGPGWLRLVLALAFAIVFARKVLQMLLKGHGLSVAVIYAFHSYFAKFPFSYGGLRFLCRRGAKNDRAK